MHDDINTLKNKYSLLQNNPFWGYMISMFLNKGLWAHIQEKPFLGVFYFL